MGVKGYRPVLVPSDDARDTVIALHKVCWPHVPEAYWDRSAHWWIIKDDAGVPVAFGGLMASSIECAGYLCRAGVIPSLRGMGLQRKLIRARIAFARSYEFRLVMTDTVYGNCASSNNLIAEGFRTFNPIAPWGHDDSSYWFKKLDQGHARTDVRRAVQSAGSDTLTAKAA